MPHSNVLPVLPFVHIFAAVRFREKHSASETHPPHATMRSISIILVILTISLCPTAKASDAVVVDSISGEPLPRASVFDRNGNLIGISSGYGRMPYATREYYPLSVRYVGYAPAIVTDPDRDSIRMQELPYELPEITVLSAQKDVLYMVGYIREFSTLTTCTDTILLFREKTVDFMIPAKRTKRLPGWRNPRMLDSRSYYKFTSYYGMDSVSNYYHQHFTWADWVGIIDRISIPDRLRSDTIDTDTIFGYYSPTSIWRRNHDTMYVDVDVLSDTTRQQWIPTISTFLHGKVDFSRLSVKYTFRNVDGIDLCADNISQMSFNIESTGRGWSLFQVFPKDQPFYVNTYAELYCIDKAYITEAQARKLYNNRPKATDIGIVRPTDAPELPPAINDLIARVDGIDHDSRRLGLKPDERLAGKGKGIPRFSIIGMLKSVVKKAREKIGR